MENANVQKISSLFLGDVFQMGQMIMKTMETMEVILILGLLNVLC